MRIRPMVFLGNTEEQPIELEVTKAITRIKDTVEVITVGITIMVTKAAIIMDTVVVTKAEIIKRTTVVHIKRIKETATNLIMVVVHTKPIKVADTKGAVEVTRPKNIRIIMNEKKPAPKYWKQAFLF
jgi:hypothetical protein